jgi:hypothetical protein
VEQIVRECARGLSAQEVAAQYPRLTDADVLAALAFAASLAALTRSGRALTNEAGLASLSGASMAISSAQKQFKFQ